MSDRATIALERQSRNSPPVKTEQFGRSMYLEVVKELDAARAELGTMRGWSLNRGQMMCLTQPKYREHSQQGNLEGGSSGVCVPRLRVQHNPVMREQGIQTPSQRVGGRCQSGRGTTHCTRKIASVAIDRVNGTKSATTVL